jgi:hypothetical protein
MGTLSSDDYSSQEGLYVNVKSFLSSSAKYSSRDLTVTNSISSTGHTRRSVLESVVQAYPDLQITAFLQSISHDLPRNILQTKPVRRGLNDSSDVIKEADGESDTVLCES